MGESDVVGFVCFSSITLTISYEVRKRIGVVARVIKAFILLILAKIVG